MLDTSRLARRTIGRRRPAVADVLVPPAIASALHQIANALQEAIGVCIQLRDEPLTPELVAQLDASLERAVAALRPLQPAI